MVSHQDIDAVKILGYIVDVPNPVAAQLLNDHWI